MSRDTPPKPRVVEREMFIPHENGRGVFPGFITYIDAQDPVLMHRYGRIDASDTYDDFMDSISRDNGRTWTDPRMRLKSRPVEGGQLRYAENAAFFDPQAGLLRTFTSRSRYRPDVSVKENRWEVEFGYYDPTEAAWAEPEVLDMGFPEGLMLSFSFPIQTSSGRLLVPAQKPRVDQRGQEMYLPGYGKRQMEARVLIGDRDARGRLSWGPSDPVTIDPQRSSRGMIEPTVAELRDGRIVMICRGDNGYYPEKPGYKWVSFSEDQGRSWSSPQPLQGADGIEYESGSNGSALIRSIANGKLYWIGNLGADGERARANWPRSPLHIAEISEAPFGIVPGSVAEIDRRREGDSPRTQHSNFRYYQDRQNGQIVVLLTRIGEEDAQENRRANYYRYRIALDADQSP